MRKTEDTTFRTFSLHILRCMYICYPNDGVSRVELIIFTHYFLERFQYVDYSIFLR